MHHLLRTESLAGINTRQHVYTRLVRRLSAFPGAKTQPAHDRRARSNFADVCIAHPARRNVPCTRQRLVPSSRRFPWKIRAPRRNNSCDNSQNSIDARYSVATICRHRFSRKNRREIAKIRRSRKGKDISTTIEGSLEDLWINDHRLGRSHAQVHSFRKEPPHLLRPCRRQSPSDFEGLRWRLTAADVARRADSECSISLLLSLAKGHLFTL